MLNAGNEPSHIIPARNRPIVIAYFTAGVMAIAKQQREVAAGLSDRESLSALGRRVAGHRSRKTKPRHC
jgi:hypothetical protein